MVAPDALVRQPHPLLALAVGRHQRTVDVDTSGALRQRCRLLAPQRHSRVVDRMGQPIDIVRREATAEVASGGRIGDGFDAQGIEEHLVVAPQLDVLQGPAPAKHVVRDVQDVVRLVVGPMAAEQMEAFVDPLTRPERTTTW